MEVVKMNKRMPVSAMLDPKIVMPAIGSAFAKLDPRPVSYTHLDVYKRQAPKIVVSDVRH